MVTSPASSRFIDGEPEIWLEPSRHEGVRNVTPKHLLNTNGSSVFNNREVQHESGLEKKVGTVLKTLPGVVEVRSQFRRIDYVDKDGVIHEHTLDYCVRYGSGRWEAIGVKEEKKRAELEAVFEGVVPEHRTLFSEFKIMTELDVPWWRVRNSASILFFRDFTDVDTEKLSTELLQRGKPRVRFYQMYALNVDRPMRTAAIWWLIDLGYLTPDPGLVNELTWFTVQL